MSKLLIIFIGLVILLSIYFSRNFLNNKKEIKLNNPITNLNTQPTPTPFPFQDLTILNMRSRDYKSNLGELKKSYETSTYIAYLTDYKSGGLNINGLLTIPKGDIPNGGWPGVIFVHGYIPPRQYQTQEQYYDYVDYLARNGLVVFKIDLRGHGNSEGEPGGAYYSNDYIIDTLSAYSALQTLDSINKNKIGLWGHSMAGNVVMRSFATKPDIPAVVIWAGAVYSYKDFREFGISDASYQPPQMSSDRVSKRQQLFDTYGQPDSGNPFWNLVAPTTYLNDLKGAIQIHHAVNDNVVNIGYSRNLNQLLDLTNVKHELNEYQSGGHNISGGSFTEAMQKTVNFFEEYLKN